MKAYYLYPHELGLFDTGFSAIAMNFLFPIYLYFFTPSPIIRIRSFWTNVLLVIVLIIHIAPLLIIPIIIEILWYIRTKDKDHPVTGFKIISFFAFFFIFSLLLHYFPRTPWVLFWWTLTITCLYVRLGTEWTPLFKYSKTLTRLQSKQEMATKEDVRIAVPSLWALVISFFPVLIAIALQIYPIPFLLGYFGKYLIQRKYFNDFSDRIFYNRWRMKVEKGIVLRIYMIVSLFTVFFSLAVYILTG